MSESESESESKSESKSENEREREREREREVSNVPGVSPAIHFLRPFGFSPRTGIGGPSTDTENGAP